MTQQPLEKILLEGKDGEQIVINKCLTKPTRYTEDGVIEYNQCLYIFEELKNKYVYLGQLKTRDRVLDTENNKDWF
jgi:hypothetical protein